VTANYKLDAMLELRKYLWQELYTRNIFDKKHIVYDKIGMSYEDNWLICCEQILFTIYSTSVSDINEIRNYMVDEFRRMDESARDINKWANLSDKFKFHTIWVADISPTAPSEELQGFFSAEVILEIKYSRITDGQGRFL